MSVGGGGIAPLLRRYEVPACAGMTEGGGRILISPLRGGWYILRPT